MGSVVATKKFARKIIFLNVCVGLLLLYTALLTLRLFMVEEDIGKMRIQFSKAVEQAELRNYEELKGYRYFIADINGKILASNDPCFIVGDSINLHMMSVGNARTSSGSRQFVIPLLNEGKQYATLMINVSAAEGIDNGKVKKTIYFFVFLLFLISFFFFELYSFVKKNLIQQLEKISIHMERIIQGNYTTSIRNESKLDIGSALFKLDCLREEILSRSCQAHKIHEKEKMIMACLSHDLKTPVSTIIGCAQGILDGVAKTPEEVRRYLEIILSKAALITRLIKDMLEHTNLELEELSVVQKEVYAGSFIDKVLEELRPDIIGRGLILEVDDVPDVLLYIAPDRIFQVFQNIVGNSVKYAGAGGKIHISFELYHKALSVEISDNGPGISATDIPFVFEPFYRGEKARTQRGITGFGLGLSIVKDIIERHGETVECDSVLGKGTVIRFLLPKI